MGKGERILITGIGGSGGSYLADYLVENHPDAGVHGISRWHSTAAGRNLAVSRDRITLHECDLNDLGSIVTALRKAEPEIIFHLAAYANVRTSFITPLAVMNNNVMGTANLFEAVRIVEMDPVIQLCSTSEVYGQVAPENVPIKEDCPMNPCSPYAVSKAAQDLMGYAYFRNYDMKVIRTRMFAYLNPRREDLFATSFAMQVARIEAGLQEELLHGNLDSVRTIIDVRDAMESYWVAATRCEYGEAYNIGGTTVIEVGQFLELLKKKARRNIPSRPDERLFRPTDVTLQIPDTGKFEARTGWKPKYDFEQSVEYLLDHCRRELGSGKDTSPT